MSHWNYRIIKTIEDGEAAYNIHEVFYDGAGIPIAWSADPCAPFGESKAEFIADLCHMIAATDKPALTVRSGVHLVEVEEED